MSDHSIYFIRAHSAIKIGVAADPLARLADLQVGSAHKLKLLAVEAGGSRRREQELHRQFAADRIRGEWFRPSPALMEHIAQNAYQAPRRRMKPRDGALFIALRRDKGWSQRDLAVLCRCTFNTIGLIERNQIDGLTHGLATRIAERLGKDLLDLFEPDVVPSRQRKRRAA